MKLSNYSKIIRTSFVWIIGFTLLFGVDSLVGAADVGADGQGKGGGPDFALRLTPEERASNLAKSGLPPEVISQLEKQKTAMRQVAIEYGVGPVTYNEYFDDGRFYQRREQAQGLKKLIHENAFDGSIMYFGEPDNPSVTMPSVLTKYLVADQTDPLRKITYFNFGFLDAAGYYAPDCAADLDAVPSVQPLVMYYLEEGHPAEIQKEGDNLRVTVHVTDRVLARARDVDLSRQRKVLEGLQRRQQTNSTATVDGEIEKIKQMQSMTPTRKISFLLDSSRGYATAERTEWTAGGQEIKEIKAEEWKHFETVDLWFPWKFTVINYANPALTEFTEKPETGVLGFTHIDFSSHPEVHFALDYTKPGTAIFDRTIPEALTNQNHMVRYTVAADGTLLRGVAHEVLAELNRAHRQRLFLIFVGINAILITSGVIVGYVRRRRKSQREV